jgi:Flp pilus assembly protein TadD
MKPYVILILLVAAAFGASLQNSFVWDDVVLIVNNPNINLQWKEIPSVITIALWEFGEYGDSSQLYYRPIPSLLTVLNYKIWGPNPFGFRLTSIVFHLICTIVLYRIGLLMLTIQDTRYRIQDTRCTIHDARYRIKIMNHESCIMNHASWIAFFSASIFAVHPVNTEPVCFASGEVVLGFFIIATLYFYLKGNEYLSLFAFFLALLSKESAVMLPFALVILSIHREGIKKGLFTIVPYIVLVITYLILRLQFVDSVFGGIPAQPLSTRLFTMAVATLDYIRLLLVPYPLSPYYPARWYTSIFEPKVLTAIVVLTSISYLAFKIRKDKIMLFLLSFPFIMLAPVIWRVSTFPVGGERVYIAERFLYVPVMAFVLFISASLMKSFKDTTRAYLIICLVAVTIVFTAITRSSTGIWKDDTTLFERIIEKTPNAAFAHNNLGNAYGSKGLTDKAIEQFQTALRLKPDYAKAYYNLGVAYTDLKMYKEAIAAYKQAIMITPNYVEAYNNLGNTYAYSGLMDTAIEYYQKTLSLNPEHVSAYNNLGNVYKSKGLTDKAIEYYKKAVDIKPDFVEAHFNLARIYYDKGLLNKSRRELEIVLQINPDDQQARAMLNELNKNVIPQLRVH